MYPALIEVGKVVGAFGIKGWLRILSYCDPRTQIGTYPVWYLATESAAFSVEAVRTHNRRLFAKLHGIDDRSRADACCGSVIHISLGSLPVLADGECYWYQLLGLAVVNLRGERLGVVKRLLPTGVHDVIIVADSGTHTEYLIPYVKQLCIRKVDLAERCVTVDWDKEWLA